MAALHDEGSYERNIFIYFLVCKGLSNDITSGWQGAPYFRIYGRELVSKPAISLTHSNSKKCCSLTPSVRNPGRECSAKRVERKVGGATATCAGFQVNQNPEPKGNLWSTGITFLGLVEGKIDGVACLTLCCLWDV